MEVLMQTGGDFVDLILPNIKKKSALCDTSKT